MSTDPDSREICCCDVSLCQTCIQGNRCRPRVQSCPCTAAHRATQRTRPHLGTWGHEVFMCRSSTFKSKQLWPSGHGTSSTHNNVGGYSYLSVIIFVCRQSEYRIDMKYCVRHEYDFLSLYKNLTQPSLSISVLTNHLVEVHSWEVTRNFFLFWPLVKTKTLV